MMFKMQDIRVVHVFEMGGKHEYHFYYGNVYPVFMAKIVADKELSIHYENEDTTPPLAKEFVEDFYNGIKSLYYYK